VQRRRDNEVRVIKRNRKSLYQNEGGENFANGFVGVKKNQNRNHHEVLSRGTTDHKDRDAAKNARLLVLPKGGHEWQVPARKEGSRGEAVKVLGNGSSDSSNYTVKFKTERTKTSSRLRERK